MRTPLPGVGVSYAFTTTRGQRAGVVSHLNGQRDLVIYDPEDHDRALFTVALVDDEPRRVAELLDLPVTVDQVADLTEALDGVEAVRIPIVAGSPYDGRTLGATRARTRTGASIVAVVRDGQVIPSPTPEFRFQHGDLAVAVGDTAAIEALHDLLAHG